MNLSNLEQTIESLGQEVNSLKGKVSLLEEQYNVSLETLENLKESQDTNTKAIETLNFIQKVTKEKIKSIFENVVTRALQYIHQSNNYQFELEFDRRGNIPKMSFLLKSPDMQESHDIVPTRAGGSKDIIALALRFVLLEVSRNKGFLFLDEPAKRLDNFETEEKMIEFIKETQKATNRQIFIITHKQSIVESVETPIIIKKRNKNLTGFDHEFPNVKFRKFTKEETEALDSYKGEPIKVKRKRGRKKKTI